MHALVEAVEEEEMNYDVAKLLPMVESAWRLREPLETWLKALVIQVHDVFQADLGAVGVLLETPRDPTLQGTIQRYAHSVRDEFYEVIAELAKFAEHTDQLRRDFATYRPVGSFSNFRCFSELKPILCRKGIGDVQFIFVGSILGDSVTLATVHGQRTPQRPEKDQLRPLLAVSEQLEAAFRCHRLLRETNPDPERLADALRPRRQTQEERVCELVVVGLDNKEIAEALELDKVDAVRKHVSNAMKKHNVHSRGKLREVLLKKGGWDPTRHL